MWQGTQCLPNPCDGKMVPHSDAAVWDAIRGNTDDTRLVHCDEGYEIFGDGGEPGRQSAVTTCLNNGTFSFLECIPRSRVEFVIRHMHDTPKMKGTDDSGKPVWEYADETFPMNYFAPPVVTESGTVMVSEMFRITHNTIAFVAGYGGSIPGANKITLVTDFEGSYLASADAGIRRNVHEPNVDGDYINVVWEVAGLIGRKGAILIESHDPILIDNFRMYDTGTGCLPECLVMEVTTCTADILTPDPDMNCLWFQHEDLPYTPVSSAGPDGLDAVQYCRHGFAPFGENGQASLLTGWKEALGISTERVEQFGMMPACMYMKVLNNGVFGFFLDDSQPVFALAQGNQPCLKKFANGTCIGEGGYEGMVPKEFMCGSTDAEAGCDAEHYDDPAHCAIRGGMQCFSDLIFDDSGFLTGCGGDFVPIPECTGAEAGTIVETCEAGEDGCVYMEADPDFDVNMFCLYETSKPRCVAFDGALKSRTQHNLYCEESEPEPTCMELVYEKKCVTGKNCGADNIGSPDVTTQNLLQCCDRSNNDPGSGCLVGRRRRRRRLSEAAPNALLTDVDAGEACAEACMRTANGPAGLPKADACVAWRLGDDNECVITTDCFYEEMAMTKLLSKKLWNTFEGVDMFKGQPGPAPVLRRYKVEE